MDIRALAESYSDYIIARRRYYHQHPELSFKEWETTKALIEDVKAMDITDIQTFDDYTGFFATLDTVSLEDFKDVGGGHRLIGHKADHLGHKRIVDVRFLSRLDLSALIGRIQLSDGFLRLLFKLRSDNGTSNDSFKKFSVSHGFFLFPTLSGEHFSVLIFKRGDYCLHSLL